MKDALDFARINAKDLARVLPFRGDRDVRYYLNGVYVEPIAGGAILVATNGHILAATFSAYSYVTEALILDTPKEFATAVKSAARTDGSARIVTKNSPLEVVNGIGATTYVKPGKSTIDGKYPDWRAVIPSEDKVAPGLPHIYNAAYLQMAIDAVCDGPKVSRYGTPVQFYHVQTDEPDGSPAMVRCGSSFVCVVMPVRDTKTPAVPAWVARPAEQRAA